MENMTIAQLKEVCAQKGITVASKANKAQISALINEAKPVAEVTSKPFRGEY